MYKQPNYSFPGTSYPSGSKPEPKYSFPCSLTSTMNGSYDPLYRPSSLNLSCKLEGSFRASSHPRGNTFSSSYSTATAPGSGFSFAPSVAPKRNGHNLAQAVCGAGIRTMEIAADSAVNSAIGKAIPVFARVSPYVQGAQLAYEGAKMGIAVANFQAENLFCSDIFEEIGENLHMKYFAPERQKSFVHNALNKPLVLPQGSGKSIAQRFKEDPRRFGADVVDRSHSLYSAASGGRKVAKVFNQKDTPLSYGQAFNPSSNSTAHEQKLQLEGLNKTFLEAEKKRLSNFPGEVSQTWAPAFREGTKRSSSQVSSFRLNDQNGRKSVPPFFKPPT